APTTSDIYPLSLHDALPICQNCEFGLKVRCSPDGQEQTRLVYRSASQQFSIEREQSSVNPEVDREHCSVVVEADPGEVLKLHILDRKSTRLNSSHSQISYAV